MDLSVDADGYFVETFDLTGSTFIIDGLNLPVMDLPDGNPGKFLIDVIFFFPFLPEFINSVGFFVILMLLFFALFFALSGLALTEVEVAATLPLEPVLVRILCLLLLNLLSSFLSNGVEIFDAS